MIEVQMIQVGELDTNCYIVTDTETEDIAIVDPGDISKKIQKVAQRYAEKIKYILLTHGHFDHIAYAKYLQNTTNAKTVISKIDEPLLRDNMLNLAIPFDGRPVPEIQADITLQDNDTLPFGNTEIKFLLTPGHTKGSGCFMIENHLFTGDTLMKLSIGRTDFPNGDIGEMRNSLRRLVQLKQNYKVYPGHGNLSDMAYEKMYNPYLNSVI